MKATVYPPRAGVPVYFCSYDVDEPLTDAKPIDTNGTSSGPDNRGADPAREGKLLDENGNPLQGPVESVLEEGETPRAIAKAILEVTMQPGDNFRVLASEVYDYVSDRQDWADDPSSIPHDLFGNRAIGYTPMITVWRRLHVEIDSMGPEYDEGNSTELDNTELTDTNKSWDLDQFNSYGEDWDLNPNTGHEPSAWFDVVSTFSTSIVVPSGSQMRSVAEAEDPYRVEFRGWHPSDDDNYRGEIPDPLVDAVSFTEAFKRAYVRIHIYTDNDSTPWHYNLGLNVTAEREYNAAHRQWDWSPDFWGVHFMGAYEPSGFGLLFPDTYDNDPDTEQCSTAGQYAGTASIYYEVLRDVADQWGWSEAETTHARKYTELHEAGHVFGLEHDESDPPPTNVMWVTDLEQDEPRDRQEDLRKSVPLVYRDSDIHEIRRHGLPRQ